jgi:hypothetical protein
VLTLDSISNLGNGMYPMVFMGKIDIYAVKNNRLDIHGCLKTIHLVECNFPEFGKKIVCLNF